MSLKTRLDALQDALKAATPGREEDRRDLLRRALVKALAALGEPDAAHPLPPGALDFRARCLRRLEELA
ncbi:MAG TPA: hypothetical protein VHN99_11075 [Deinococcales bacterium]|nr:hypothetical protein [Deinococcales bacterium]